MANNYLSPCIPMLYTTGTYYQVGYNVGSFFGDKIRRYFYGSERVQKVYLPYTKTEKGKQFYDEVLQACTANFPEHIREIQGMADGSGLSFSDIFLQHIWKEIRNVLVHEEKVLSEPTNCAGCTDIFINTPGMKISAHNEDTEPLMSNYAYMVNARIVEDGKTMEHFTAYCNPGCLPGCTFTVNKHGMIFTVNETSLDYTVRKAPTQMMMNRAVIKARNIDEAVTILKNRGFGSAYGFNTNIIDAKCPSQMWCVELAGRAYDSLVHVHTIREEVSVEKPGHYVHTNSYEHLPFQKLSTLSSERRRQRAKEMESPRNKQDILNILGDTSDPEYPIYRSSRPTDDYQTIYTTVADVLENRIDIYQGNPARDGAIPTLSFRIMD